MISGRSGEPKLRQFVAATGGILMQGLLSNSNEPGGWEEKFQVDATGNLSIRGEAYKPGGGSWSTLSDRRAKQSIEPLQNALDRLLRLRGVTYEYANTFLIVAGLLNTLVVIDAFDIAVGRK